MVIAILMIHLLPPQDFSDCFSRFKFTPSLRKAKARIDNNLRSVILYKYLQHESLYDNSSNYKLKKKLIKNYIIARLFCEKRICKHWTWPGLPKLFLGKGIRSLCVWACARARVQPFIYIHIRSHRIKFKEIKKMIITSFPVS